MSDYRPVDCAVHSLYEEAILLRRQLRLTWRTPEGGVREEVVRPLDVMATQGEEFLLAHDRSGAELRLRLDWITHAETIGQESP